MKLPNASAARVDVTKIRDYLLSSTHPKGRDKRRVFRQLGFDDDRWLDLLRELSRAGRDGEVVKQVSTIYGTKYVIDAAIAGPRATGLVRTVWMLERGHAAPRLVTAYPLGEPNEGA
ncbi:MAG: DUF6883 domain-containing protein [Longimicrobiales bacterium]